MVHISFLGYFGILAASGGTRSYSAQDKDVKMHPPPILRMSQCQREQPIKGKCLDGMTKA